MAPTRVYIAFTSVQLKVLDQLAKKLGLDRNNAIRYCLARVAEQELKARPSGS